MADPMLIVSPHLDDAVLSCGQLMAGRPDIIVATVCTAAPPSPHDKALTTYDRDCGYVNAGHAMQNRRLDDMNAVGSLRGSTVHLGFLDHQYRELGHGTLDPAAIAEALVRVVDEHGIGMAMGPLGLAHPDHEATAEAFRLLLQHHRRQIEPWVYEDTPSRVLWPELVPARLAWWADVAGLHPELGFAGTGPLEAKEAAISHYPSQLDALRAVSGGNLHTVLVPERHHRLWRRDP